MSLPDKVWKQFYSYRLRLTDSDDRDLAIRWSANPEAAEFWLKQNSNRTNVLVLEDNEPLAFFQVEAVAPGQCRIHFQASLQASAKKILKGVIKLVPLIEKSLALRGTRAIFFTSHSPNMAEFMRKHLDYHYAGDGGADGVMMAKGLRP